MVFATGEYGGDGKIAYRLAKESDIEAICDLIKSAITVMENNSIFQWDSIYPTKDDFLADIKESQLFIADCILLYVLQISSHFETFRFSHLPL